MYLRIHRGSSLTVTLATTLAATALALPSVALAQDQIGTGTLERPRDISVTMTDTLRFDPAEITVGAGEVVRFVLANPTAAPHDFVIGDLETQDEHGVQMAAGMMHMHGACPEAEDDHAGEAMADEDMMMGDEMSSHMPEDDASLGHPDESMGDMDEAADYAEGELCPGGIPGAVTIEPGETVTVLARFHEPGETLIGCHQPGHWEAGMKGVITIIDAGSGIVTSSPVP